MNFIRYFFFIFLLTLGFNANSQKQKKSDKQIVSNLRTHIQFLAADKLEGRRAGTAGESLAMNYITEQFSQIGLQPKGSEGYLQAFEINDGKGINPSTEFLINGNRLETGKDFFPLPYSANGSLKALPAISVQESDMPWFIDLKEAIDENKNNPHFDLGDYLHQQALIFQKKGASAIIFYNSSPFDDQLKFEPKDKQEAARIPVLYVSRAAAKKYFGDESSSIEMNLKVDLGERRRTGHNVVGYIDNHSPNTIIIGAHYDHLGYGEDGNSMLRTGEVLIHNGADDNASGTAAMMELARMLKASKLTNNNFLFIAFSGEELGLFGSKYFVDNPTIDLASVNYMINMDMVGRLNDSTKALTIGGYGTSPEWSRVVVATDKKLPFTIKIDSSGTGPSDHTSFYRKNIPVLFFFTGLHQDYHKPSDDFDKINYDGELTIVKYVYGLVEKENKQNQRLVFTKTREVQTSTTARMGVTLGVMPDYTFSGTGLRIDGVTDGRPAKTAGLQAGDIIVQLGDYSVSSMETYMQALSKFKKGDTATVRFKRGNDLKDLKVQF